MSDDPCQDLFGLAKLRCYAAIELGIKVEELGSPTIASALLPLNEVDWTKLTVGRLGFSSEIPLTATYPIDTGVVIPVLTTTNGSIYNGGLTRSQIWESLSSGFSEAAVKKISDVYGYEGVVVAFKPNSASTAFVSYDYFMDIMTELHYLDWLDNPDNYTFSDNGGDEVQNGNYTHLRRLVEPGSFTLGITGNSFLLDGVNIALEHDLDKSPPWPKLSLKYFHKQEINL